MGYRIVLASKSPRRKELLEKIGLEFEIWPSKVEEVMTKTSPEEVCVELCRQKALDVASQIKTYSEEHPDLTTPQDILVIGSDTIVAIPKVDRSEESSDGASHTQYDLLGKPKDTSDAKRMLNMLSDNMHSVFTGVSFVFISKEGRVGEYSFFEKTDVYFYPVDDDDIDQYIESGEPMDKAGAYGIQGEFLKFVKKIDGDFYNVVGLPVSRMWYELSNLGVKI
ncbi:MAG: Maf family protein [Lachnospiraceae bacterium]|nr:Maf family protein [Lachnospiraceae bacterium]